MFLAGIEMRVLPGAYSVHIGAKHIEKPLIWTAQVGNCLHAVLLLLTSTTEIVGETRVPDCKPIRFALLILPSLIVHSLSGVKKSAFDISATSRKRNCSTNRFQRSTVRHVQAIRRSLSCKTRSIHFIAPTCAG